MEAPGGGVYGANGPHLVTLPTGGSLLRLSRGTERAEMDVEWMESGSWGSWEPWGRDSGQRGWVGKGGALSALSHSMSCRDRAWLGWGWEEGRGERSISAGGGPRRQGVKEALCLHSAHQ